VNCPKCGHEQSDENMECIRCGLIFSQYKPLDYNQILDRQSSSENAPLFKRTIKYLIRTKDKTEIVYFAGRLFVLVLLIVWSVKFFQSSIADNYTGKSFMHLVNLPFHEAGHLVFLPFGKVLHSLGGSLGQVIMPLVCALVLLVRTRDTFGASIAFWWAGESILDLAPYIDDARSMTLQLLGGNTGSSAPYGFHDWNFVLSELNLLRYDHLLADIAFTGGRLIMSFALLWGLAVLIRQATRLKKFPS